MNLALREMRTAPGRHLLLVTVIALLITASLGMISLYRGIVADATAVLVRSQPSLWVVERGTIGPFAERSAIDGAIADELISLPGVARVRRYIQFVREMALPQGRRRVSILGLDVRADPGEWLPISAGRAPRDARDIAVDGTLGLSLGSHVSLDGHSYFVSGILRDFVDTEGDPILVAPLDDARRLMTPDAAVGARRRDRLIARTLDGTPFDRTLADAQDQSPAVRSALHDRPAAMVSAIMLDLAPNATQAAVIEAAGRHRSVSVLTQQDQIDNIVDRRMRKLRLQILFFTTFILIIAGVLSGLIVYSRVLENRGNIALLAYLGARRRFIARYVTDTTILLVVEGYVVASLVGTALFRLFPRRTELLLSDRIAVGAILLAICLLTSIYAIRVALMTPPREALA